MLAPCTIKAMHIIIFLLGFHQSLLLDIRHGTMQAALVSAIVLAHFIIKELSVCSRRTTLIPNRNIRRHSKHKITYPY